MSIITYTFTAKELADETGIYDYGFRDYDPLVMRWTTIDPIKSGLNWYNYVNNDPFINEKISDDWENLPEEIRDFEPDSAWGAMVDDLTQIIREFKIVLTKGKKGEALLLFNVPDDFKKNQNIRIIKLLAFKKSNNLVELPPF